MLNHNLHHPQLLTEFGDLCDFKASDMVSDSPSIHQKLYEIIFVDSHLKLKQLQRGSAFF